MSLEIPPTERILWVSITRSTTGLFIIVVGPPATKFCVAEFSPDAPSCGAFREADAPVEAPPDVWYGEISAVTNEPMGRASASVDEPSMLALESRSEANLPENIIA